MKETIKWILSDLALLIWKREERENTIRAYRHYFDHDYRPGIFVFPVRKKMVAAGWRYHSNPGEWRGPKIEDEHGRACNPNR